MLGGVSRLDFKLGFRMLIKYPGLTIVGGLAIAVGIGVGAAFFEVTEDVYVPTLPFEDGERIVRIQNWDLAEAGPEPRSLHDYVTWRSELGSFEEVGALSGLEYQVSTEGGRFESVQGARVTASLIALLRVPPLLGRPVLAADEAQGAPAVAVIGYDLWQRLFDGDPGVIGRTVRLGNSTSTVVGVMPEGFGFPVNHELWTPLRANPLDYARREGPAIQIFGRLASGFTRDEAQAELTAIGVRAATEFPVTNERLRPRIAAYMDFDDVAIIRVANVIFLLILLVVCANVATLVFAKTATREAEIALRSALGAGRRRIVLQLIAEALVLTSAAAAVGLAAAAWVTDWGMDLAWDVQQMRPPFWYDEGLSLPTVLYTAALALFGAVVVGGVPALKATGRRLQPRLAQGRSRLRFGAVATGVIVVQVALCVAFLPVAVLTGQEMLPDRGAAVGFPAGEFLSGRLTRQLEAPWSALSEAERDAFLARTAELQDEVKRRLSAEPGLAGVTFIERIPGFNHISERIHIEGDPVPPDSAFDEAVRTLAVDLDFFDVMEARIVAGRTFTAADLESDIGVVILGESFARRTLDGRNAVGQRIRFPDRGESEGKRWHQVVGVVEDPAMVAAGAGEYVGLYRPLAPGDEVSVQMYLHAPSNPESLVPRIHSLITSLDPTLALAEFKPLDEIWEPVLRSDRFFLVLLTVVGTLTLALSLAGIYALMSFTVAQRAREIAIRAALGARPRRIVAAIFSRALAQIGLGVVAGAALVSLTVIESGEGARLVAIVAALMFTVAMLACAVPTIRALRIHPAEVLKEG